MDRWEYQIVRVTPTAQGTEELSRLGREGWRVIKVLEPSRDQGAFQVLMERPLRGGGGL